MERWTFLDPAMRSGHALYIHQWLQRWLSERCSAFTWPWLYYRYIVAVAFRVLFYLFRIDSLTCILSWNHGPFTHSLTHSLVSSCLRCTPADQPTSHPTSNLKIAFLSCCGCASAHTTTTTIPTAEADIWWDQQTEGCVDCLFDSGLLSRVCGPQPPSIFLPPL
ncbi:hypothetical protein BKA81DRAFT_149280 [Phyllosticta paracitricarpa]